MCSANGASKALVRDSTHHDLAQTHPLASACSETNPSSGMENLYGTTFSGIFGYGHITGGYPGSQAEYVRVPFANTNCVKLPDDVPDEKGLYLSDIVVTSHHAAVSADIQKGETVGVWGKPFLEN